MMIVKPKLVNKEENVKQTKSKKEWGRVQEEKKVSFKSIMESQIKEEYISKAVVKEVKEKEGLAKRHNGKEVHCCVQN